MLWLRYVDPHGYPRFGLGGKSVKAYHVSYILAHGPIPDGLVIDHVRDKGCTNRHCVAPLHLEAVTQRENLLRGTGFAARNAQKTHCPQGHEYAGDNLYVDAKGRRYCQACRRVHNRNRSKT